MEKYLKGYHPGAYTSRPTLIKYRRRLENLELFTCYERRFGGGLRFPTEYMKIDLVACLLFCEALEITLLDEIHGGGGYAGDLVLPPHKYFSLVWLFNVAMEPFKLAWRRVWEDEPLFPIFDFDCQF